MNGWLLVRIAGIGVGIATLLRVATNEGIVTYDPLFLAWMDWLSDIVELGFLTKLIGPFLHWGIDQVRGFGISVPDLQDEWRPAFIFSTLLFGAIARNNSSPLLFLAASLASLAVAIWSGLSGSLVPVAVVASIFPSTLVMSFRYTTRTDLGLNSELVAATVRLVTIIAMVVIFVAYAPNIVTFFLKGLATLSPTLSAALADTPTSVVVAAFVALAGFGALQTAVIQKFRGGPAAVFVSANFRTGIDILFTMATAFLIAVAAANPPIW
jgi:hypothetical protein